MQENIDGRPMLTGENTKYFHTRYNIYLILLIRSHTVTIAIIEAYFGPFHQLFYVLCMNYVASFRCGC